MSKVFYCPVCGWRHSKGFVEVCYHCYAKVPSAESRFDVEIYRDMSEEKSGTRAWWYDCLLEEIKQTPLYDKEAHEQVAQKWDAENKARLNAIIKAEQNNSSMNVPHCPTCGSTNVSKISAAKRGAHMFAFGFFSKTAVSQFECKNCGYKW